MHFNDPQTKFIVDSLYKHPVFSTIDNHNHVFEGNWPLYDEESKSTNECQPKILSSLNNLVAEYQQYQDATAEDDDDFENKDSNKETVEQPKRKAAGAGVDRLEMRFDGKNIQT